MRMSIHAVACELKYKPSGTDGGAASMISSLSSFVSWLGPAAARPLSVRSSMLISAGPSAAIHSRSVLQRI